MLATSCPPQKPTSALLSLCRRPSTLILSSRRAAIQYCRVNAHPKRSNATSGVKTIYVAGAGKWLVTRNLKGLLTRYGASGLLTEDGALVDCEDALTDGGHYALEISPHYVARNITINIHNCGLEEDWVESLHYPEVGQKLLEELLVDRGAHGLTNPGISEVLTNVCQLQDGCEYNLEFDMAIVDVNEIMQRAGNALLASSPPPAGYKEACSAALRAVINSKYPNAPVVQLQHSGANDQSGVEWIDGCWLPTEQSMYFCFHTLTLTDSTSVSIPMDIELRICRSRQLGEEMGAVKALYPFIACETVWGGMKERATVLKMNRHVGIFVRRGNKYQPVHGPMKPWSI